MSEDDPSFERCPICQDKECQRHLLARFDTSEDEGEFGVGLAGGALVDAKEIEQVLGHVWPPARPPPWVPYR